MMLLELIAVLALIVIIVSLSMPTFSVFDRLLVRTELNTLYLTCTSLQQQAQATGKPQELTFSIKDNTYMWKNNKHTLHASVRLGILPKIKGPPAEPRAIITRPVTFPGDKIVFHPDGIVQAGSVYLIDKAQRFLCALTCSVSHVSYMRRYIYDSRWMPA